MILFDDVSIRRGSKELINNASLQLHPNFKVGLCGKNGTGKSSLFAVFMGNLGIDTGNLEVPSSWVVAHMAQEVHATSQTALDFVLSGDAEWFEINAKLENPDSVSDDELAKLHERYDSIDGFTAKSRAAQMLSGLGFKENQHQNSVDSFSGGWQMRLNLAKTLMCRSDLLLLDEPTNHLDLDAILWLEEWLNKYTGTLLLISHDQQFLDAVVTHILNLENQQLDMYTGNYQQFLAVRSERLAQHEQAIKKQEETKKHLQSYIDRFRAKATKAKQAQSRIKQLERMQTLSPILAEHEFSFKFYEPTHMNSPLVTITKADVGYGNTSIIGNVTLEITPDTRLGLLGVNGAGKSTLIKAIVGELPLINGVIKTSETLKIGYFSQHKVDALENDATPLLIMRRLAEKEGKPQTSDADHRSFLGSFGFIGDRIDTPVQVFSGGERARLNLAMIIWQRPNMLILDEPTNHLDISMKQALTVAIQNFTGALMLVSHDRELISAVCDHLYLVHDGKCDEFGGDIHDYAQWLRDLRKAQNKADNSSAKLEKSLQENGVQENKPKELSKEEKRKLAAQQRKLTAPLRKKIEALEKLLEKSTAQLEQIEEQLGESSMYDEANKDTLLELMDTRANVSSKHDANEEELLMLMEELEDMLNDFT